MNVTWHDSDLAFAGLDDTGAVGSNQTGLVLGSHDRLNLDHVQSWDSFSDADNEINLRFHSFENGIGSKRRRHVDNGSLGVSSLHGFTHVCKHGQTEVLAASFASVDAADHLGSVLKRLLSVERALQVR